MDGRTVTLAADAPLAVNRNHGVLAGNLSIEDLAGGTVSAPFFLSFTTGSSSDGTALQVVTVSPPNGVIGVPTNASIVIEMDEPR